MSLYFSLFMYNLYSIVLLKIANQHTIMHNKAMLLMLMKHFMNAGEKMLTGYADYDAGYPSSDPDAT